MSKTSAQDYYNQQAGDPDDGYITPDDAKASVGVIYDDMAAADNLAAKAATIGNLLTANQASVETDTTGLTSPSSDTVARTTSHAFVGSASMLLTATSASGDRSAGSPRGTSGIAVTPGETYTATAAVKTVTGTRARRVKILWWTAAGAYISEVVTPSSASSGSFEVLTVTATAPATAAYANVEAYMTSAGSVGDSIAVDCFGLWKGSSGQWALPGTPITGTGYRVRPGGLVDVWDGTQWLNIGTGTPVTHAEQLPAPDTVPSG
jgi:hypothetical protein